MAIEYCFRHETSTLTVGIEGPESRVLLNARTVLSTRLAGGRGRGETAASIACCEFPVLPGSLASAHGATARSTSVDHRMLQ